MGALDQHGIEEQNSPRHIHALAPDLDRAAPDLSYSTDFPDKDLATMLRPAVREESFSRMSRQHVDFATHFQMRPGDVSRGEEDSPRAIAAEEGVKVRAAPPAAEAVPARSVQLRPQLDLQSLPPSRLRPAAGPPPFLRFFETPRNRYPLAPPLSRCNPTLSEAVAETLTIPETIPNLLGLGESGPPAGRHPVTCRRAEPVLGPRLERKDGAGRSAKGQRGRAQSLQRRGIRRVLVRPIG